MKQLLIDTQARILAEAPAIKYVDEDWGQLDDYSPNPPVKWPCVLIDVNTAQWSNEGKKVQMAIVQVSIKVANQRLTNSSGMAPQSQKEKAWEIFDYMETVHVALHGFALNGKTGPLMRTTTRKIKRADGVQMYEVIYSVQLFDDSARPQTTSTPLQTVSIAV